MIAGAKDKLRGKMIINPKYVCDFFDAAAVSRASLTVCCTYHRHVEVSSGTGGRGKGSHFWSSLTVMHVTIYPAGLWKCFFKVMEEKNFLKLSKKIFFQLMFNHNNQNKAE